jgi:tRNA wybutosine-synthesizing protein 4
MDKLYSLRLDTAERQKIEKIEIFDEFEEWVLLQSHYCLTLGKRFNCEGAEKVNI